MQLCQLWLNIDVVRTQGLRITSSDQLLHLPKSSGARSDFSGKDHLEMQVAQTAMHQINGHLQTQSDSHLGSREWLGDGQILRRSGVHQGAAA